MAGTKTITSDKSETKVGASGTKLWTATRVTYYFDDNGQIDPTKTKKEILYYKTPLTIQPEVGAVQTGTSKDWEFQNLAGFGQPVLGTDAQKSLKEGALKTTTNNQIKISAQKEGLSIEQQKSLTGDNVGSTDPNSQEQQVTGEDIEKELEDAKKRSKEDYVKLLVYPVNLKVEYQDCIKFSMLEYVNPGLSPVEASQVNRIVSINREGRPTIGKGDKERSIITTIVLPIPGGINDSNSVDWQGDELDLVKLGIGNMVMQSITKGGDGFKQSTTEAQTAVKGNISALQSFVASKSTEIVTGSSRIMQRAYGAALNPNLELLFTGPRLRSFGFIFKLSPRSEKEAIVVRKIIRYFKQGMTPKRSKGYLLLQSPHTFAISYMSGNKDHPYLNKFKECALTQCNVNYTPNGTYMSFDGQERSMTSYELTLQFQELVPLYDDDYDTYEKDNNLQKDSIIGF